MEAMYDLKHTTDEREGRPLEDYSTSSSLKVMFRNLNESAADFIEQSDFVVGCVAWLTCPIILEAMKKPKFGVSIIVQKEDFLRPDSGMAIGWKSVLRKRYDALSCNVNRFDFDRLIEFTSCGDPSIHPVRCVGNHNKHRSPAFPRMHHKFMIRCKIVSHDDIASRGVMSTSIDDIVPISVWTGSFNFTKNGGLSFENAIVISDSDICRAYFDEYQQIAGLSEPLDWEVDWCQPEWRIGS